MRILVASIGAHGHTYPLLPLAVAAREAGHDILHATAERFHPLLARLGFRPLTSGIEIGAAFEEVRAELGPDLPERSEMTFEQTMAFAVRVFGDVLPRRSLADLGPLIAEHRPDLVIHEVADLGAGLAARVAGVPGLCHGFGRVADGRAPFTAAAVAPLIAELGLDVPADAPPGLGDPYVDICPPSLQGRELLGLAQRVPLRPVAFAEPGELPAWVREPGLPLVYLTMGTAFGDTTVMERAIAALGRLDARVLVATGPTVDAAAFGPLPGNVHVEPWVPQADLLPHAALVVHHGGSGTTLGCLGAGVPQLFLPQGADQFDNAAAVTAAGAGEQVLPADLTADALADRAGRLLADPVVRHRAGEFAAEIAAMPGPAEVAARLAEFAAP